MSLARATDPLTGFRASAVEARAPERCDYTRCPHGREIPPGSVFVLTHREGSRTFKRYHPGCESPEVRELVRSLNLSSWT